MLSLIYNKLNAPKSFCYLRRVCCNKEKINKSRFYKHFTYYSCYFKVYVQIDRPCVNYLVKFFFFFFFISVSKGQPRLAALAVSGHLVAWMSCSTAGHCPTHGLAFGRCIQGLSESSSFRGSRDLFSVVTAASSPNFWVWNIFIHLSDSFLQQVEVEAFQLSANDNESALFC